MSCLEPSLLSKAICSIFDYDEHWIYFIFSHKEPKIRALPEELIQEAACFSQCEQIKIRVALDIWTGQGHVSIAEIVDVLDYESLLRVVRAIFIVRELSIRDLEDLRGLNED